MIYFFQIYQLQIKINFFFGNQNIILIHIYHVRTIDQKESKSMKREKKREEKKKEK